MSPSWRPWRLGAIFWCCLIAELIVSSCGCDKPDKPAGAVRISVVATTSIIGDWVHVVGGEDVNLTILVGPDGDPHEYEPVPGDSIALARASIVFENGLGLENWLDKLLSSSESKATRIIVTDGIELRVPPADGALGKNRDPHAWQDVAAAITMVTNIRDALIKSDPAHSAVYHSRAEAYLNQLSELDRWVQEQIQSLPQSRRDLVTSHDAFGYFARRYGMNVTRSALESVTSEASDPSARQIADVVAQINSARVPAVFLENVQNPKLIDEIAAEAHVKVAPALYSDALGQPGTAGDTYLKMIRYNVNTMVKALSDR